MRGRKHPLEVFRLSGRAFVTKPQDGIEQVGSGNPEAPSGTGRGGRRRSLAAAEATASEPEPEVAVKQKPRQTDPARRTWDVRLKGETDRPVRSERKSTLATPLPQVAAVLAGLVLLVGAAYALGLWPFAPTGTAGDTSLRRWLRIWGEEQPAETEDREATAPEGVDGAEPTADPEQGPTGLRADGAGAGDAAAKTAVATEYWVVAASVKLTATNRKNDAWKESFGSDVQRLQRELGTTFPGMRIQTCKDAKGEGAMVRVGPAPTADDPTLARLHRRIRELGGSFKDARITRFAR